MPNPQAALRILVTGAGGLLGRALCERLAARGHAVSGLLRRGGTGALPDGIRPVLGDVAEPGLGMEAPPALDLVIHCAAVTGFRLPDETYRRVNVDGTARVLQFVAARPGTALLHVSTAYVCGDAGGPVAERPASGTRFNNGYEASKAAAEALVWAARAGGVPAAVARPSIVVGDWADGAARSFGTVYQLIRLLTEGRVRVLPIAAGSSLDLVPADHVVAGLVDLAEGFAAAEGRVFHLASGRPVAIAALSEAAAAFPQFHLPRLVAADRFDPASVGPRERRLHARVVDAYAAYLRPSPVFETAGLAGLSGRRCPPVDGPFLRRLLRFAVDAGFLPGPTRQRTSG